MDELILKAIEFRMWRNGRLQELVQVKTMKEFEALLDNPKKFWERLSC